MKTMYDEPTLPYGTLARFGLTQEMIEDLPVDVLQHIYEGGFSPVLPVRFIDKDGAVITGRARFMVAEVEDFQLEAIFVPMRKGPHLEDLPENVRRMVLDRKVAFGRFNEPGEEKAGLRYFQLDTATNQVMNVPTAIIASNLQVLARRAELQAADVQALQSGEVVTFHNEYEDEYTVGIDLASPFGLRFEPGDEERWRRLGEKTNLEKYNFGVYGCWVWNEDGSMDYISDEDYTEEMWNEQKRQGLRQAGGRGL